MEPQSLALAVQDFQAKHLSVLTQEGLVIKAEAEALKVENASDLNLANQTFKRAQALRKKIEFDRKDLIFPAQDFVKQINALAKECGLPGEQAELIISEKILAFNTHQETLRRQEAEKERLRLEEQRLKEEQERQARDAEEARLRKIEEDRLNEIRLEQERERARIALEHDANKKAQRELEAKRLEEEAKLETERVRIAQQKRDMEEQQRQIDTQKKALAEAEQAKELPEVAKVSGLRTTWTYDIENEAAVPRELCSPDSKKINAAIKLGLRVANGLKIYEAKRIQ